jgi:hypothetical protein
MLHINLFGPIAYISIGGSKYCLVLVDDYSRFTWVFFLQEKTQTQVLGPSASEGPQKHDLTMFSKWNMRTGIFEIVLRVYKSMVKTKLEWNGRQSWRRIRWSRAMHRKASAWQQKRGTDLKMKSQIRPRRITIELLINVKGINVILHGLRPVPINRWTVLPYCSRWLGIRFSHHACTFTFHQSEGTFIICYYKYDNANKNKLMIIAVLLFVFHVRILFYHLSSLRRVFPS